MKLHGADTTTVHGIVSRLRELVAALDRRTPRPERTGATQIAAESAELREEAIQRITQLEIRKLC